MTIEELEQYRWISTEIDALNEQIIFKATRKQSIYSLAKLSGYEAFAFWKRAR